ncbi:MAG: shikimate dehydrogenase [Gammaproteobacteria bacterium]
MSETDEVFDSLEALLGAAAGRSCCAVVGNPIAHSLSPTIHAHFGRLCHVPLFYGKWQLTAEHFVEAVRAFFHAGGLGLNVTVPFKEQALAVCDALTERAIVAGAVNTLWCDGRQLWGDNTDGVGLVNDLKGRCGLPLMGNEVLILGAGGAARGIVAPLFSAGVSAIAVANRTRQKAEKIVACFKEDEEKGIQKQGALSVVTADAIRATPFDVIINATGAGLTGQVPALQASWFGSNTAVYDMMYAPLTQPQRDTAFLAHVVSTYGVTACWDGLGMLVEQASVAFARWFDQNPDVVSVRRILEA